MRKRFVELLETVAKSVRGESLVVMDLVWIILCKLAQGEVRASIVVRL